MERLLQGLLFEHVVCEGNEPSTESPADKLLIFALDLEAVGVRDGFRPSMDVLLLLRSTAKSIFS